MTSEMIERVAMAIKDEMGKALNAKPLLGDSSSGNWYTDDSAGSMDLIIVARAAIEAMREPSEKMVNAAWSDYEKSKGGVLVEENSVSHWRGDKCFGELKNDTAYEVWQAMIDAALQD